MESKGNIFLWMSQWQMFTRIDRNFLKEISKEFQQSIIYQHPFSLFNRSRRHSKISRFDFDVDKKTTVRHSSLEPMDPKTIEILGRTKTAMSSLFARAVILVEGETELAAIPKWFNEFLEAP